MDVIDIAHLDSSSQIMIAEHQRLTQLYLHNSEMGEKRTSLYLSIVSLGAVGLMGLAQLIEPRLLFWPANGILVGMIILGILTFHRLIERRIRAVENLRALNRIHRYFVDRDARLVDYFYWPPCDDVPSFHGRGGVFAGLRDIIAFANSLFGGFLAGEMLRTFWPAFHILAPIGLGLAAGLSFWVLHQVYERTTFDKAERWALARDIRYPWVKFACGQDSLPEGDNPQE